MIVETTLESILDIVREVDERGAFLVSKDEPDFSTVEFLRAFQKKPGFRLFAWTEQAQKAGFISILPHSDPHTFYIGPMYIRPSFQGQRLGYAQMAAAVEWARQQGAKRLLVRTWGKNVRARRIIERLGFRLDREIPDARINGDSTVYYVLDIENE